MKDKSVTRREKTLKPYRTPAITVVGTVAELTAGPTTPNPETPSGQKKGRNAAPARTEDDRPR